MKNVTKLKNVLYRARNKGLLINTHERTITMSSAANESGKYRKFTDILTGAGFVIVISEMEIKEARVLVFAHKGAEDAVKHATMTLLRRSGYHMAQCTSEDLPGALRGIISCQRVSFLNGWENDDNALLLLAIAKKLNKTITLN